MEREAKMQRILKKSRLTATSTFLFLHNFTQFLNQARLEVFT